MVATLLWGRLAFGIDLLDLAHPVLFGFAVASDGRLDRVRSGFLLAVAFVRYRHAWALGNMLEYPSGSIRASSCRSRSSPAGSADLLGARRRPGASALRARRPGGGAWPEIGMCLGLALGLPRASASFFLHVFERLARTQATLALT